MVPIFLEGVDKITTLTEDRVVQLVEIELVLLINRDKEVVEAQVQFLETIIKVHQEQAKIQLNLNLKIIR